MLLLALVHSYKNYGKVQVDCLEGCRCARQGVCALARPFRGGGHSSHIARKPGSSGSSLCVRACMRAPFHSCTPLVVDTIWERDATLPEIVAVDVTAAEHCNWRLTVLNETSSDGHKVKLLGFMIAESDRVRAWGAAAENLG